MDEKILVVDDVDINREILCELMRDEYQVFEAANGQEAVEIIKQHKDELEVVLLDVIMPVMDGFAVLQVMKENDWLANLPVLFITGDASAEVERRGFEMGISDFIQKPFEEFVIKKRVRNIVDLYQHKKRLEERVKEQTQILRKQFRVLKLQAEKLKETNNNIIDVLGNVVEYRNLESGEHVKRVQGFTRILAEEVMKEYPEYGLNEDEIQIIETTSALHDIGKIAIPDNILTKPGKLTPEEFECMKSHTTRGCELLDNIKGVWDENYRKVGYDICRYHHERYDGRGYPEGLKGDEIPIAAQIVSVADVYDALVSERVYKAAVPRDKAFQMILDGQCGVFSPKLMECFRNTREAFEELHDKLHA